ncbi:MAG: DUF4162 domain-containing protein, partial [Candidatus Bathyarchaeia archaeon]
VSLPNVKDVKHTSNHYRIKVERGQEALPKIIEKILQMKKKIRRVSLTEPTLDHVYLEYTGRTMRETEGSHEEAFRMRRYLRRIRR